MSTVTISGAGAHASAAATDRIPASKAGVKGYLTNTQIGDLFGLTPTAQTVTADTPVLNLAQTWNNGAVAFTGLKFNATDSASSASSLLLDLQVGGASKWSIDKGGLLNASSDLRSSGSLWGKADSSKLLLGVSADIQLAREAANTLALRNGTNAQAFRLYNTYTDASNYERGFARWAANVFEIGTENAGTGSARSLALYGQGILAATIGSSSIIVSGRSLLWASDNSQDIGASGASRPRNLYVGTNGVFGGSITATQGFQAGNSASFYWNGRSNIASSADGIITLCNAALTDFSRLQFGGATSSFPALKRNGSALQARFADDSGYCALYAGQIFASGGNAIAAGGNSSSALFMSTTASFGVFFGSGAPSVSAAKGSLYLRSDGSGVADRAYINTDGGTTWTAIATAG